MRLTEFGRACRDLCLGVGACAALAGVVSCGKGDDALGRISQSLEWRTVGTHWVNFNDNPDYQHSAACDDPSQGWKPDLPGWFTVCHRFFNRMEEEPNVLTGSNANLHGRRVYWEPDKDQDADNGLESLDLFMGCTHGQAAPHDAIPACPEIAADTSVRVKWSMWDVNSSARGNKMYLGNENVGLSIFATYSCQTAKWDEDTWYRWNHIFRGGLRVALGTTGGLVACYNAQKDPCPDQLEHGRKFAQYLVAGIDIALAWGYAFAMPGDNRTWDPASIVTGTSPTNCRSRRDNMNWQNFGDYERLEDDEITTICGWQWVDLD